MSQIKSKIRGNTWVSSLVFPVIKSVVHNSTSIRNSYPNILLKYYVPLKPKTELSCGLSAHFELSMLLHSTSLKNSTGHALNKTASIRMSHPGSKGIKISFSVG